MHVHYGSVGAIYVARVERNLKALNLIRTRHIQLSRHVSIVIWEQWLKEQEVKYPVRNSTDGTGLTAQTKWNLTTCNVAGCHTSEIKTTSTLWAATRKAEIKGLL